MEFLHILAVVLIACAACTGIVIVTELGCCIFFKIKDHVMPIFTGKNDKKQKTLQMEPKFKKTESPSYEELQREIEMLRKERLNMKAHMDRLIGIVDTLLSVKNELERKVIRPQSPNDGKEHVVKFSERTVNTSI